MLAQLWRVRVTPLGAEPTEFQGPEMGGAILAFYHSAAQPAMAELGRDLAGLLHEHAQVA